MNSRSTTVALVLLALVAGALTSCSAKKTESGAHGPQYGAAGFDTAGEDTTTAPGDDFFRFANGGWVDKTEIPADKPAYSLRAAISDQTEQRLHGRLEGAGAKAGQ